MFGLTQLGSCVASGALWLDQLWRVNQFFAFIALVTLCIMIVTHRALTSDVPVSQESVALEAKELINNL